MKTETEALAVQSQEVQPASVLATILQLSADPNARIDVIERLVALQQSQEDRQRKTAYIAAMTRVAAKLIPVKKGATGHFGPYADIADIDRMLRPILSAEGLALSYDSGEVPGKPNHVRIFCTNSHVDGHEVTKQIDLEIDKSGGKNACQAPISTVSYGRRTLTKMFYNLIEEGEDTDGESKAKITDEQVKDLNTQIQDLGMNMGRFLMFMSVGALEDILAVDIKKAQNAIDVQREAVHAATRTVADVGVEGHPDDRHGVVLHRAHLSEWVPVAGLGHDRSPIAADVMGSRAVDDVDCVNPVAEVSSGARFVDAGS